MSLIDNLRLNVSYPELKDIILTEEVKKEILKQNDFRKNYKALIKNFVLAMKEYASSDSLDQKSEMMNYHLSQVLKLKDQQAIDKYIKFIDTMFYSKKLENIEVLHDDHFEELFKLIGYKIFDDNISTIIKNGYGDRLLAFRKTNTATFDVSHLNISLFEDKVWNIIKENPTLKDKSLFEVFESGGRDTLIEIIQKDLFEGMKYTYENIEESHIFFTTMNNTKREVYSIDQFSMNFIHHMGDNTLNALYKRSIFRYKEEFSKLFQITELGNYELIQDIVNYDPYNFSFSKISKEQIQKELIETDIFDKREILVNKYFGIKRKDIPYIQLFLTAINQADLPKDFEETYKDMLQLLNKAFSASDEEILEMKKSLTKENKEAYKKLIASCEQEGNEVLKEKFVTDLQKKNQEIKDNAIHIVSTHRGIFDYDIYELVGQPFTMLVHAITNNRSSCHNSFVEEIINDPSKWKQINNGNVFLSTSLISDQSMATYGQPNDEKTVLYGFSNFSPGALKYTTPDDAGIDRKASEDANINMRSFLNIASLNTISTIDDIMEKTIQNNKDGSNNWNEIGLVRRNIRPDFIVCMDHIYDASIRAATYFHVPIYVIQRSKYQNSSTRVENDSLQEANESNHIRK